MNIYKFNYLGNFSYPLALSMSKGASSKFVLVLFFFVSFSSLQSGDWGTQTWNRYDREVKEIRRSEKESFFSFFLGVGNAFAIKEYVEPVILCKERISSSFRCMILINLAFINCLNIFQRKEKIAQRIGMTLFGMSAPFWA